MKAIVRIYLFAFLLALVVLFSNITNASNFVAFSESGFDSVGNRPDSSFKADMQFLFQVIERNTNDTIINILSAIIDGVNPPDNRYIAQEAYEYFINPKYMGQEIVGITIAKKYLLDKFVDSIGEEAYSIESYIKLIEPSMIGKPAQNLDLIDNEGRQFRLSDVNGYRILYFYSADCATCNIETPKLHNFLKGYAGIPVSLAAVYVEPIERDSSKMQIWSDYVQKWFSFSNSNVNIYNLYDPEFLSDFPLKYAVVSTPQMFLIDENGVIIGRSLRTAALEQLLGMCNAERRLLYEIFDFAFLKFSDNGYVNYKSGRKAIDDLVGAKLGSSVSALNSNKDVVMSNILNSLTGYLNSSKMPLMDSLKMKSSTKRRLVKYINKKYR